VAFFQIQCNLPEARKV